MGILLFAVWYILVFVQGFMGLGTAYRLTKSGGDNGIALWGWMLLMGIASVVPGLGIYLWLKYRDDEYPGRDVSHLNTATRRPTWMDQAGNNGPPPEGKDWRDNIY